MKIVAGENELVDIPRSGASTWSLTDHEILVNNADPSLQQAEQTLYHTRNGL